MKNQNDILIEILRSLKLRTAAVFEMGAEIEGLKAALDEDQRKTFGRVAEETRHGSRIAFEGEMNLLSEAIQLLQSMQQG